MNFLKKYNKTICLSIILILTGLLYSRVFEYLPRTDSWKLLTAANIPSTFSIEYWIHIFTSPTSGPQYRPISYFLTFFLGRLFFGDNFWPYYIAGLMLLLCTLSFLFLLILKLTKESFISLICVLFFAFHQHTYGLMTDITNIVKYFLPLFILILGLYLIEQNSHKEQKNIFLLFILSIIAILTHEGALSFPLIFIGYRFVKNSRLLKKDLVLLIPSLVYLIARLIVFEIPRHGFMQVGTKHLVFAYGNFISSFLLPKFLMTGSFLGLFFLLFLIGLTIYFYTKDQSKLPSFFLFSCLLLLGPFSLLVRHLGQPNRSLWALAVMPIFIAFVLTKVKLSNALSFLLIGSLILIQVQGIRRTHQHVLHQNAQQRDLKEKLKQQIDQFNKVNYGFKKRFPNTWIYRQIFPGFLAYHFPHKKFTLHFIDSPNHLVSVSKGTFYEYRENKWLDGFGFDSSRHLPLEYTVSSTEQELQAEISSILSLVRSSYANKKKSL